MTVTHHSGHGAPHPPAGAQTPGGPLGGPPPGYDWRYAPPPPRRRSKLLAAGVMAAILLSAAALATGIVSLVRPAPTPPAPPASSAASAKPTGDTTEADRALCKAIAPLMAESDRMHNSYVDLGDPGTPARDAATPKFITDTQDWIRRIQPVVDANPNVDPFLQRSLQRVIDDQHLLVLDLTPGPLSYYAKTLWPDSVGAYSGPLHICDRLGVKW